MKKITIVMAVCAIALAACKKEHGKDYFSCKIDGVSFYMDNTDSNGRANSTSNIGFRGGVRDANRLMQIDAVNTDYSSITMVVNYTYTGKGSYTLAEGGTRGWYSTLESQWNVDSSYHSSSGILTITSETSSSIEGTFAFDAVCEYNCDSSILLHVTEGKFKVPFKHY